MNCRSSWDEGGELCAAFNNLHVALLSIPYLAPPSPALARHATPRHATPRPVTTLHPACTREVGRAGSQSDLVKGLQQGQKRGGEVTSETAQSSPAQHRPQPCCYLVLHDVVLPCLVGPRDSNTERPQPQPRPRPQPATRPASRLSGSVCCR